MENWLYHEHNLKAKITSPKYKQYAEVFTKFIKEVYEPFKQKQMEIKGIKKEDISKKLELVEKYYKDVQNFIKTFPEAQRSNLSSRAKLETVRFRDSVPAHPDKIPPTARSPGQSP